MPLETTTAFGRQKFMLTFPPVLRLPQQEYVEIKDAAIQCLQSTIDLMGCSINERFITGPREVVEVVRQRISSFVSDNGCRFLLTGEVESLQPLE